MMKTRVFLLLILLAIGFVGKADDGHRPLYDSSHTTDLIEGNLHAGLGISSIVNNYNKVLPGLTDFLNSPGCLMRTGLDVRFNIRNSFGLGTGLEWSINNSRFALSIVDNPVGSISSVYIKNHYFDINVPVYLSWRFNLANEVMWNVDAGAYFGYGIAGTMKASGYNSGINSLGQPIVTQASYSNDYFNSDRSYINTINKMDYGPRLATGLVYNQKFTFNIVCQMSLPNLAKNPGALDVRYRNLTLMFQVGYNIF